MQVTFNNRVIPHVTPLSDIVAQQKLLCLLLSRHCIATDARCLMQRLYRELPLYYELHHKIHLRPSNQVYTHANKVVANTIKNYKDPVNVV